jgi:hypothetical protein
MIHSDYRFTGKNRERLFLRSSSSPLSESQSKEGRRLHGGGSWYK